MHEGECRSGAGKAQIAFASDRDAQIVGVVVNERCAPFSQLTISDLAQMRGVRTSVVRDGAK